MVEEPPLGEKIRIEVMSKRLIIGYRSKVHYNCHSVLFVFLRVCLDTS